MITSKSFHHYSESQLHQQDADIGHDRIAAVNLPALTDGASDLCCDAANSQLPGVIG